MKTVCIHFPHTPLSGTVLLPASKSVSNRALIIQAVCDAPFNIHNLSDADDTRMLQQAISFPAAAENVGAGGTTFRFLLALRALQGHTGVLSGSPRLNERPVQILVELLRSLGADISYTEKDGFPPLRLNGGVMRGGAVPADASVSSQFISALMLIGPRLPGGLTILPEGNKVSAAYIRMTAAMMQFFGMPVRYTADAIIVPEGNYVPADITIGADWSAAAFFYALAALSPHSEIRLPGLSFDHWQGDEAVASIMEDWGVITNVSGDGVVLHSSGIPHREFMYDLLETPDLAQALAVMAAVSGRKLTLTGLQTLKQKETDRILALKEALALAGARVEAGTDFLHVLSAVSKEKTEQTVFGAYHDHRMVMALSLLACSGAKVRIEDADQVNKSFPGFFEGLKSIGGVVNY